MTEGPSRSRSRLSAPLADLVAQRLRLLDQAMRIRLVVELQNRRWTVQEIADALGTTQQNASQHVRILHQAGTLTREKKGTRVYYELVDTHLRSIIDQALASLARQSDELARVTAKRST